MAAQFHDHSQKKNILLVLLLLVIFPVQQASAQLFTYEVPLKIVATFDTTANQNQLQNVINNNIVPKMATAINDRMIGIATVSLNQDLKFVKQIDRTGNQPDRYELYPDVVASFMFTELTPDELKIKTDQIMDDFVIILFDEVTPIIPCGQNIQVHIHKSFGSIDTQITGLPC